jgi:hypothetical protein
MFAQQTVTGRRRWLAPNLDLCCQRVKPSLFGSIKGLPKEAACPKASQNPVCSWDTLWQGLPAKKSVSHAKLSPQFASGTRGSRQDAINPSKVGNTTVSALLSGVRHRFAPPKKQFASRYAPKNSIEANAVIFRFFSNFISLKILQNSLMSAPF